MPFCAQCGAQYDAKECPRCANAPIIPPPLTIPPPSSTAYPNASATSPTSGLAIASLVLGILGCTSLIGLILGGVALFQINGSQGRLKGSGVAIGGMIVSVVMMIVSIVFCINVTKKIQHGGFVEKGKEVMLSTTLDMMRESIREFKSDTGVYPARLEDLVAENEAGLSKPVKPGTYHGPYYPPKEGIYANQRTNTYSQQHVLPPNFCGNLADKDMSHHWKYNPATGTVKSAVQGKTHDGKSFTDL